MARMVDKQAILYCSHCLNTFSSDVDQCPNLRCAQVRPAEGWGRMYVAGDVIDRNYKVLQRLAMGGAGVTYLVKALDDQGEVTGQRIALKLLFAARDHGSYLRRLSTEAQILQELQHPNIVKYLGFVHRTGHSPYLLTHFEEGGSLLDYMRDSGTFSIRDAASIGRQVCWALAKGHAQGIIHRDLKPENLLLAERPRPGETPIVRVADFGIAKVTGGLHAGLTRAGAFVGTPQYAAPEQFLGEAASDKADVYALGAVMMFLMTAKPVVKDAHILAPEDVYTRLLDSLPPVIDRQEDSVAEIQAINAVLAHAMCLDPSERCSVDDLDRMLSDVLLGNTPSNPVMAVSTEASGTNILDPVVGNAQGSLTMSGDYNDLMAEHPSPTLRDDVTSLEERVEIATKISDADARKMAQEAPRASWTPRLLIMVTLLLLVAMGGWLTTLLAEEANAPLVDENSQAVTESTSDVVVKSRAEDQQEPKPDLDPKKPQEPIAPAIIDAVQNPSLGTSARKAAMLAFKRNAQNIRRLCPQAVGKRIEVEVLMSTTGRVSWARSTRKNRTAYQCVADNMKGGKSGSRFRLPTKVRLYVEP